MNVNIQTVHFAADRKLIDYVENKIRKLETFNGRIVEVKVFLKLDNFAQAIKDKIAEIRVHVPKQQFFVKSTSKSFEGSFDEAMDSLIMLLKKNKERKAA